jgi:hypothetical protein
MKKGAHDRAVQTPEGAPRLFDLITPGHFSITPALYLAVGNTLVAPDLETATRWAYEYGKRWRVVTLDGKLIETSGTMSGGGNSVQKGKMKLSVSPCIMIICWAKIVLSTQLILMKYQYPSLLTSFYRMVRKVLSPILWKNSPPKIATSLSNKRRLPKMNSNPAVLNVVS